MIRSRISRLPAVAGIAFLGLSAATAFAAQLPDGRIEFGTTDAAVSGSAVIDGTAGVRLGSGSGVVRWNYKPTRWGKYDVVAEVRAAGEVSLAVDVAGTPVSFRGTVPKKGTASTGTVTVGRVYVAKSDPFQVTVSSDAAAAAGFELTRLTLVPAPEGEPVRAGADGELVLKSSQATTHSVTMRYEPAAVKNCLGYWVNPADWADWQFPVARSGMYDVEVWQGCGKGQGGSDVAVEIDERRFEFVVEETGHFQIFLPRRVGRVWLEGGVMHSLAIKPQKKKAGAVMDIRQVRLVPVAPAAAAVESAPKGPATWKTARRIVALGDSITYGGGWVEWLETWMRLQNPGTTVEWINVGLPSETVSGLSEEGHAGGAFPRPDAHERLDRVLAQTRPDLVLICYGMNDGIYFPYGEDRAARFQDGMRRLHTKVEVAGAHAIHLTSPMFDSVPLAGRTLPAGRDRYPQPYEGYDEVLTRYSQWLISQRSAGWEVIDVHGPMRQYVDERRKREAAFTLAGDGVHPNGQGHWVIAREVLRHWGADAALVLDDTPNTLLKWRPEAPAVAERVAQRQRITKDSWLTATGHKRPGMSRGLPLAEARAQSGRLNAAIHALTDGQFPGKRSLWYGFERFDFEVDGHPVTVVAPKHEAPGRPWLWEAEFFGHKPNPDLALLGRGFHVVYLSVPNLLGSPTAVADWNALHRELTTRYGFSPKPAISGLSRGGLYAYNWAIANPDKVSCIYGDAPVCDFKSWPGGKGKGPGSAGDWKLVLQLHGFRDDAEAMAYRGNPVDNLQPLARAKVPLLHVYGDADEVVPWDENTGLLATRYKQLGGSITLIAKPGVKHHPHGLDDSTPIVDFIWKHAAGPAAQAWLLARGGGPQDAAGRPLIRKLGTVDVDLVETTPVVFLGRLWRFEWVRQGAGQQYWGNQRQTNFFRFRDPDTGEVTAPFADGCEFGSAFVEDGAVYVTGTVNRSQVDVFVSRDLKTWQRHTAIPAGRYGIYNTSICRTDKDHVLMFEIDRPKSEAGVPFTARFARSKDLLRWKLTSPDSSYSRDRYTAPHCLRWKDGWFYDFYLEAHEGYELRVVRSRDLKRWEASPLNPVLRASPEDKLIANGRIPDDQRSRIANAVNLNNSDLDLCERDGRLVMNYSWGNQQGVEHLASAVYDGTLAQFLDGWFPKAGRR